MKDFKMPAAQHPTICVQRPGDWGDRNTITDTARIKSGSYGRDVDRQVVCVEHARADDYAALAREIADVGCQASGVRPAATREADDGKAHNLRRSGLLSKLSCRV